MVDDMTMILVDGFDHADSVDVWTSFVATIATDTVRTGTRSAQQSAAGGPTAYRALNATEIDDGVTMGIAAYQGSAESLGGFLGGTSGCKIVLMEDTVVHLSGCFRNDTRTCEIWRGTPASGTRLAFTDTNIWTHNTWHYLELQGKIHDTTGTAELRLNGVTVLSVSGADTRNGGTSGVVNRMGFRGNEDSGSAQQVRFEDAYLLNEQGAAPWNTFLGDTRCFPLYPNGNGNYSQLLGSDGNSTDNYLLVDEVGTPSSTDYVGSATDGQHDSYTFENMPVSVGTIRAVETRLYAAKSETGAKQMRPLIRRSAVDYFGADHVLAENSYATYRDIFNVDPSTSAAWTITNVDAAEFGAEIRP